METFSFYTTGDALTETIRDLWDSNLVYNAFMACEDSGMTREDALKLCIGQLKLEGDTREGDHTLEIVDDNTEREFTLEWQVETLEQDLINYANENAARIRQHQLSLCPTLKDQEYREVEGIRDLSVIKKANDKIKSIIKSLELVYPLAKKSMCDLPITSIGTEFSVSEQDKIIDAYEKMEQFKARNSSYTQKIKKEIKNDDKDDKEDPKPEPTFIIGKYNNGWISPEGKFYGCEHQGHIYLATLLSDHNIITLNDGTSNEERWLENNGWIKFQSRAFVFDVRNRNRIPTESQLNLIIEFWQSNVDIKRIFNYTQYESISKFYEFIEEEKGRGLL